MMIILMVFVNGLLWGSSMSRISLIFNHSLHTEIMFDILIHIHICKSLGHMGPVLWVVGGRGRLKVGHVGVWGGWFLFS
jgi:hypothetical protein